jgi:membrane associated rhomboid family serine protease
MAYYRPTESIPPVVKNLLIANVLVFFAQQMFEAQGKPLEFHAALWDYRSPYFRVWQLVTHMFMHASFFHILFNMFGLWMFGKELENRWGSKRFLQFYIICGLAAGLAQLLLQTNFVAVGASGAIMGVFAAFAYLFPNTPLVIFPIFIPIKAKWAIPGLMAIDLFGGIARMPGDNVAHWAHLGGAITGLIVVFIWNKRNRNTFY